MMTNYGKSGKGGYGDDYYYGSGKSLFYSLSSSRAMKKSQFYPTSATALSSSNPMLNTTGDISQLSTPRHMSTGGISEAQNIEFRLLLVLTTFKKIMTP
eukprot:scaffold13809_cov22-Cyclotella_meneghiniana.AAC.1